AQKSITAPIPQAVLLFHQNGKSGNLLAAVPGAFRFRDRDRMRQYGRVPLQISLDMRGLVPMPAQAPHKHTEAVVIIRLLAAFDRRPQPALLPVFAVARFSQRKVRSDPAAFGVLRDLIGNSHHKPSREYPSALALGVANQTPILRRNWRRLRNGLALRHPLA